MNAPSAAQRIVAVLLIAAGTPVLASQVRIYSDDFSLPIPAPDAPGSEFGKGWMEDAIIQVPDHFIFDDIDVGFTLTHTSAFDLQIFLQSPAGTSLCLNMYNFDEYFEGENYTQTIFDDEAELPIEQGHPPFTGRFRPKAIDPFNTLEIFDGQDAFGAWRLRIYDAWYADTGTLNHFELVFSTPEPATAVLLTLGIALITLFKPRGNP
jgi:hypothetical protein